MFTEAYVKQLEEKIELLEKENKNLHETGEYLTRKLFGRSTEKTSAVLGQLSFFDEAENEADPDERQLGTYPNCLFLFLLTL